MTEGVPIVNIEAPPDTGESTENEAIDLYKILRTPADDNLEKEYAWLQQIRCLQVIDRVTRALKGIGRHLNIGNKMDPRMGIPPSEAKTQRLELGSKSGADQVKAVISLLSDNVISCEISLKHSKSPGGIYRGVAQPEVQWKLQQLQDLSNFIAKTSFILVEAQSRAKELFQGQKWDRIGGAIIHQSIKEARNALSSAQNAMVLPRKRTLLDLCQFPPTKKFNPSFPIDQIVSIYASGPRLICAVYQMNPKQPIGSGKDIGVVSAECIIPGMPQVLQRIAGSLRIMQEFLNEMEALRPKLP